MKAKCFECNKTIEIPKTVEKPLVEKGNNEYRPDVKLILIGGEVIDCEVIYTNYPNIDKLKKYQENNDKLLIWKISGNVDKVPQYNQHYWEERDTLKLFFEQRQIPEAYLPLFASPTIPNHICKYRGEVYVGDVECWKCDKKTPVVACASWSPDLDKPENLGCDIISVDSIELRLYVRQTSIPEGLWRAFNKALHINYCSSSSQMAGITYMMNHCNSCGIRIGDADVKRNFNLNSFTKIIFEYELTEDEREIIKRQRSDVGDSNLLTLT
jgi:hypothetical protein